MPDIDQEQPTIKQYLLRRLDEEGQRQFEERFVTDSEFREVALVVEEELIEDYLAGLLTEDEQENFVSHYLSTPRQSEELKLSQALREYATQAAADGTPAAAAARTTRGRHWIINLLLGKDRRPVLAVALPILIALAVVWGLIVRQRWGDQRAVLNAEVALLNTRPLGNVSVLTVPLTDANNRSAGQAQKVNIPGGIDIVQFSLNPPGPQYQSYEATLYVNDGPEVLTVSGLRAQQTNAERFVKLNMPARLLTPDDYILRVSGENAAGQSEDVADIFFRVVK